MKNILLSITVIAIFILGGYYLFSNNKVEIKNNPISLNSFQDDSSQEKVPENNGESFAETSIKKEINNSINNKSNMITIETNYGKIVIETYNTDAPNTVANFVTLANKGFYNGLIFHRVIKGFMIQGGDPQGTGTGGPGYKFNDELNPDSPSYKAGYKKGVVAMANSGPNTNGSQFFIMTDDYPLPNAYTIFGKVVSGQDIVDKIANVETGASDRPTTPVTMKIVSVE